MVRPCFAQGGNSLTIRIIAHWKKSKWKKCSIVWVTLRSDTEIYWHTFAIWIALKGHCKNQNVSLHILQILLMKVTWKNIFLHFDYFASILMMLRDILHSTAEKSWSIHSLFFNQLNQITQYNFDLYQWINQPLLHFRQVSDSLFWYLC